MPAPANLVHETTTGTGTGNLTLVAESGKQTFNLAFGTGGTDLFTYFVSHTGAAEWEVGTGHLSDATTLVRDTVIDSSNSDSAVSFSAGTKNVTNDVQAAQSSGLDVAKEWTATQNFNETSLTSTAASVAWAAAANQVATHTLTENTTIAAPSGLVAGAFYSLKIVQHASSPKTVAYNAVFKFPGGTTPTMTATNSAVDIMTFRSDGTNMYMVGLVQAMA